MEGRVNITRKSLPSDLTFEQFKALADKQPDLSGPAIYRLEHTLKDSNATYPKFNVSTNEYFFLSLADAEKFMREKLIISGDTDDTYRFCIIRIPTGEISRRMDAVWVYDKEGGLIDHCSYHKDAEKNAIFFGRSESRIRFHKGDIVEVVGSDEVTLAVIAADGPTVEWFWDLYGRSKDKYGYPADDTDDCYYALDGPGYAYHSHLNSTCLMPLSMPLDDDIRAYFEHCLECAEIEDCRDKYNTDFFFPRDLDRFGETLLEIIYDRETKRHRLQLISEFGNEGRVKTFLTEDYDPQRLKRINEWLTGVMYGRTRLWYLIRSYNEDRDEDTEPELNPFTTFTQLTSKV